MESCKVVQCDMFVGAIDSISLNYLKILVIKGKSEQVMSKFACKIP